jgi:anaerobic selenocysteine-containing dehydrogenase
MGVELSGDADLDTLTDELYLRGILERSPLDADEVFAAGPRGFDLPVEYGWVHETMLPDGTWRIAPTVLLERLAAHREPPPGLVLSPGREPAWSNSVRYGSGADDARLHVGRADAAEIGIADGNLATVVSEHGAVEATVVVDERLRAGVVSLVHGRRGCSPGTLVSTRAEVDPLTSMPRTSGVAVRIEVSS